MQFLVFNFQHYLYFISPSMAPEQRIRNTLLVVNVVSLWNLCANLQLTAIVICHIHCHLSKGNEVESVLSGFKKFLHCDKSNNLWKISLNARCNSTDNLMFILNLCGCAWMYTLNCYYVHKHLQENL